MRKCLSDRWGNNPPENIWVGATYTGRKCVDDLINTPAAIRWLSVEPMLSSLDDLTEYLWDGYENSPKYSRKEYPLGLIHWVVFGAESGPRRRYCSTTWIESGISQFKQVGVKCFVKQIHLNRQLVEPNDPFPFPEWLRIREYPQVKENKK